MDALAQHYFEIQLELLFRKARGDSFQQLFGRIMTMANPGDFVQTRPWGKLGDEKCDGYLCSKRVFYQCYAPNELSQAETIRKLREDFSGALPHAKEFFDVWVFTHNAEDGRIPTWLIKEIESLRGNHQEIKLELLGYEELRKIVFSLPFEELVSLLGPPVTQRAMLSLGLAELKPILNHLGQHDPPEDEEPRPVSPEKLAYNVLPQGVEVLLRAGMTKASLVEQYFARTANKELGMRVAKAFRNEYCRLRGQLFDGLEIFDGLRQFALGPYRAETGADVASLAVLAYLFEVCDIFENPSETVQ